MSDLAASLRDGMVDRLQLFEGVRCMAGGSMPLRGATGPREPYPQLIDGWSIVGGQLDPTPSAYEFGVGLE